MYLVEVWISHPIFKIDQTYTYSCKQEVHVGCRVLVSFHKQILVGFVDQVQLVEVLPTVEYEVKEIYQVMDERPILNEELMALGKWMAQTTISPTIACYQAMLPSSIKPSNRKQKIVMKTMVKCNKDFDTTSLKEDIREFLYTFKEPMLLSEARKISLSRVNRLLKLNALIKYEVNYRKNTFQAQGTLKTLTTNQQACYKEIMETHHTTYVLHGITGSGKTEVYLHLAYQAVKQGKQVLILVPEIALTAMMIQRVTAIFGNDVAIYHSGLNNSEKYQQYQLVMNKEVSVVVGTRSSIFMPFEQLGFIILDEAHDASYKQDKVPCYNTIDIAIKRNEYFKGKVILASATPLIDTYAKAIKKVYHLVTLNQRINKQMPIVKLIDMQKSMKEDHKAILSKSLLQAMEETLAKKQQIIILLNRRGYTTLYQCSSCQHVIMCDCCDVAMSYHRSDNCLKCHVCGLIKPLPQTCPSCGYHKFSTYGYGTQKVEELLNMRFPEARVLRMDQDTTGHKNSHFHMLSAFEKQEYDILLGTQMIAKGLDFPNVSLVGILNADAGLNRLDYRSVETTFDLIVQASGRSGRSHTKGSVMVQVFHADHYAIQCAIKNDYPSFFVQEMKFRHLGQYPPYTYFIAIYISDIYDHVALESLQYLLSLFEQCSFERLGPSKILKLVNYHRYRFIIKGKDLQAMQKEVYEIIKLYFDKKGKSNIRVDVNPYYLD